MNISDKLGEMKSVHSWTIERSPEEEFRVVFWTMPKIGPRMLHETKTEFYQNIYKALDRAIELMKQHISDCPIC